MKSFFVDQGGSGDIGTLGQGVHTFMDQQGITNYFWIDPGLGHVNEVWKDGFWNFLQLAEMCDDAARPLNQKLGGDARRAAALVDLRGFLGEPYFAETPLARVEVNRREVRHRQEL